LVYYTGKIVMTEAQHERDTVNKGFFERAAITIKFRLSIKSRYPAMNKFMDSVFKEDEPEVAADIERLQAIATDMHSKVEVGANESGIFKSGIDPTCVVSLVEKYTEGVINGWDNRVSIDETISDVTKCLDILKMNLCK